MSTPDEVRIRIESDPGWRKINAAPKGTTISGNTRMRAHPNLERRKAALEAELNAMKQREAEIDELIEGIRLAKADALPHERASRIVELVEKYRAYLEFENG